MGQIDVNGKQKFVEQIPRRRVDLKIYGWNFPKYSCYRNFERRAEIILALAVPSKNSVVHDSRSDNPEFIFCFKKSSFVLENLGKALEAKYQRSLGTLHLNTIVV